MQNPFCTGVPVVRMTMAQVAQQPGSRPGDYSDGRTGLLRETVAGQTVVPGPQPVPDTVPKELVKLLFGLFPRPGDQALVGHPAAQQLAPDRAAECGRAGYE